MLSSARALELNSDPRNEKREAVIKALDVGGSSCGRLTLECSWRVKLFDSAGFLSATAILRLL